MDKRIFIAISDRIKEMCPSVRWIEEDEGQLSGEDRPRVALPCCLLDISYPSCSQLSGVRQTVTVSVSLRVGFDTTGGTAAGTPSPVRNQALSKMDILQEIHQALQWWNGGKLFNPLVRLRCVPEKRRAGIKVYVMSYQTEMIG